MFRILLLVSAFALTLGTSSVSGALFGLLGLTDNRITNVFQQIDTWLNQNVDSDDVKANIERGGEYFESARDSMDDKLAGSWLRLLDMAKLYQYEGACVLDGVNLLKKNIQSSGLKVDPTTRVAKIVKHYQDLHEESCAELYALLYEAEIVTPVREDIDVLGDIVEAFVADYSLTNNQNKPLVLNEETIKALNKFAKRCDTKAVARAIVTGVRKREHYALLKTGADPKNVDPEPFDQLAKAIGEKCENHKRDFSKLMKFRLGADPFVRAKLEFKRFGLMEGWLIYGFCNPLLKNHDKARLVDLMIKEVQRLEELKE